MSRGLGIQTWTRKEFTGRTPYGAESPSRLACPNQGSELQASFHFPRVSCAEPRPGHAHQVCFPPASGPRSKTICMSKSEPRPGHANQFWFSTGAPAPLKNPFACPSLNPDQDMQINFGFPRAPRPRSKTLCMSKSEPRPGHANQFWFSTGAPAPLKNPLHVQV